ncbi:hypothetical protein NE237_004843 [Protea cynaroides]|uniref:Uncharacterized protein n=1 Tax=Protea cynaroides TaxID=273540 RepID=A0A9Q0QU23_9MAGN|nr:hypothetical protein NE237_004843 [Protea cynaroides]
MAAPVVPSPGASVSSASTVPAPSGSDQSTEDVFLLDGEFGDVREENPQLTLVGRVLVLLHGQKKVNAAGLPQQFQSPRLHLFLCRFYHLPFRPITIFPPQNPTFVNAVLQLLPRFSDITLNHQDSPTMSRSSSGPTLSFEGTYTGYLGLGSSLVESPDNPVSFPIVAEPPILDSGHQVVAKGAHLSVVIDDTLVEVWTPQEVIEKAMATFHEYVRSSPRLAKHMGWEPLSPSFSAPK